MGDWLGLDAEREGLFGSLMRLTRCNNVGIVVSRLSGSVSCVVSSSRNMRESQLVTFTSRRLYGRIYRGHVSRFALRLCRYLDRLDMTQPDRVVSRNPDLWRCDGWSGGLRESCGYFRGWRCTKHSDRQSRRDYPRDCQNWQEP